MKLILHNLPLLLLLVLLYPTVLLGNTIKAKLELSSTTFYLGDELSFRLKLDGAKQDVELVFPEVEGLRFRQLGPPSSSSQTIIVNGKMTSFSGLVYNLGVTSGKPGEYSVPGIVIKHPQGETRTNPFRLRVIPPDAQSTTQLEVSVQKNSIFVGEPVRVSFRWYIQENVKDYILRFPLIQKKDPLRLRLDSPQTGRQTIELMIEDYKVPFTKSDAKLDGEPYTLYEARFILYPEDDGKLVIPASSAKAYVQRGTETRRDFFGRLVRAPKLEAIFASAPEIVLDVLPVPQKDRPPSFSGAVGEFDIKVEASYGRVKVGDPIELNIEITGEGLLDKIERPVLSEIEGFKDDFIVKDSLKPGDIEENKIVFHQTVQPNKSGDLKIPPIPFTFFDPKQKRFRTIRSEPIFIQVSKAQVVSGDDLVLPSGVTHDQGSKSPFDPNDSNLYTKGILQDQPNSLLYLIFLLVPPGLFFLSVLLKKKLPKGIGRRLMKKIEENSSSLDALNQAEELLTKDANRFYRQLEKALDFSLKDNFGLELGRNLKSSPHPQAPIQGEINGNTIQKVASLIEEFEERRFTGIEASLEQKKDSLKKTRGLIEEIESR